MDVPLKRLAQLRVDRARLKPAALLTLDVVESGTGRLVTHEWPEANLPPEVGFADAERGDILFGKLRPYLAKVLLVEEPSYASTELMCLRPLDGVNPRWLRYVLLSRPAIEWSIATSEGTKMPRTSWERLATFRVRSTSPEEQQAIADFLDTETSRIDALITRKRRMIDLLQERWHAERDRVLVDRVDVTMVPLARLTDPYRPIVYGIVQAGDHVEHGVPYIKTGDLEDFDPRRLSRTSADIDHQYRRARVHPGDLVMAMRASIGALVEIPDDLPHANLTQGTARIAAAQGVSRRWLTHVLGTSTVQEQCQDRAVGSTFRTLNIWDLRRVQVPTPPLQAQEEVIRHLDRLEVRMRNGTRAIGRQISLLQEHRQALITAAVTGELEVPGVAA